MNDTSFPLAGHTVVRSAPVERVRCTVHYSTIPAGDGVAGECWHDVQLPVGDVNVVW